MLLKQFLQLFIIVLVRTILWRGVLSWRSEDFSVKYFLQLTFCSLTFFLAWHCCIIILTFLKNIILYIHAAIPLDIKLKRLENLCTFKLQVLSKNNMLRVSNKPSKHLSWWRRLRYVFNTSFVLVFRRRLQDVLIKTNIFTLAIRLQKVSLRHLYQDKYIRFGHTSSIQDVFKTFTRIFKTSSRRLPKTSSRHLQEILQRYLQDIFKTF